jgi:TRAP-type C4-dicarboxylate transport system permease large subunit
MRLTLPMVRLSPGGRIGVLWVSVVAPVVLGSPIEDLPVLVRFGPLLCPTVRQSGVTDRPDGMVVRLAKVLVFAPPPLCDCAACIVGQVPPGGDRREIWVGPAWLGLELLVVAVAPWISTCFL